MEITVQAARIVSILAFFFYGFSCTFSDGMVAEFERYGLSRMRRLIGVLEILGAAGLLLGYLFPPLVILASGGLSLLMFLGILTRMRIQDPLPAMLPAFVLMVANLLILVDAA